MTSIIGWRSATQTFPFPIVKFMDYYTLIFNLFNDEGWDIDVYEAYCGNDDVWVATQILNAQSVDWSPRQNRIIASVDVADFGHFYMASIMLEDRSSGTRAIDSASTISFIRKPGVASGTNAIEELPLYSAPRAFSCCNYNGQAILGGIYIPSGEAENEWTRLGRCAVAWSGIGQFEFRPSVDKTAGFLRMPWSTWDQGHIYKVEKLGKAVMVYGNGGRAALVPYSSQQATGFGLKPLSGYGIDNGWRMAGDEKLHGFIDMNNEFWVVDEGLNFQKLGYKEFIDDMIARDGHGPEGGRNESEGYPITVSYDPKGKRFYIAGIRDGYVLTEFGLYSTHQSVTSVGYSRGGVLTGFVKELPGHEARVVVDDKDFKVRALKTVDVLEYGVDYPSAGVGTQLAPKVCCTDPDSDVNNTDGWTYSGAGSLSSATGGVSEDGSTSYRLKLNKV